MLPVVGVIDCKRVLDMMHVMLDCIAHTQAKVFILDISGVAVVDTAVTNYLIKLTKVTQLLGCVCTLSGISPPIAQALAALGSQVSDLVITATLRDALADSFRRTGVRIGGREEHP